MVQLRKGPEAFQAVAMMMKGIEILCGKLQ